MNDKIIKYLSQYKSFFSIVGLCCVIFYFVASKILSLDIFSQLKEDQTYFILSYMLYYFFILSISAVAIGGLGFLLDKIGPKKDPNTADNDIKISNVGLLEHKNYTHHSKEKGIIHVKRR